MASIGDRESSQQLLAEYDRSYRPLPDPRLDAVSRAILLEDVLDVVLTDEQMQPENLRSAEDVHRILDEAQS